MRWYLSIPKNRSGSMNYATGEGGMYFSRNNWYQWHSVFIQVTHEMHIRGHQFERKI